MTTYIVKARVWLPVELPPDVPNVHLWEYVVAATNNALPAHVEVADVTSFVKQDESNAA